MQITRPSWLVQRADLHTLLVLSDEEALRELHRLVGPGQRLRGRSWWSLVRSWLPVAGAAVGVAAVLALYVLALLRLA